jgi:hypothetical protein
MAVMVYSGAWENTDSGKNPKVSWHFPLKVPKHENFSIAFFALSEPIWVCDVGTTKKIEFFYRLTPDFDSFGFFAAY